jgi:hypothetical protein
MISSLRGMPNGAMPPISCLIGQGAMSLQLSAPILRGPRREQIVLLGGLCRQSVGTLPPVSPCRARAALVDPSAEHRNPRTPRAAASGVLSPSRVRGSRRSPQS